MKDWKTIAKASGLEIPDGEADRIARVLGRLEETFRPLVKTLRPETEPATAVRLPEDDQ